MVAAAAAVTARMATVAATARALAAAAAAGEAVAPVEMRAAGGGWRLQTFAGAKRTGFDMST